MVKRLLPLALVLLALPSADVRIEPPAGGGWRPAVSHRPAVEAAFERESYARGSTARLVLSSSARSVSVRIYRAGTERGRILPKDELRGTPVAPPAALGGVWTGRVVRVRVGDWPGGLYYAKLTAAGGRIGYAPFVLRPRGLGEHRIAVVLPTFTWQAYNFRDDDGDGRPDTWYFDKSERAVLLGRPHENRGVPTSYRHYDQPFLRWLSRTGRAVDYLADTDLAATRGDTLARAYDLVVFPGHHEYVTASEYAAVRRFRDLGGNLLFLSANNFYWRVDLRGDRIWKVARWRDLGRPEAALIGVQYLDNDEGEHRGAWIVRETAGLRWLFAGTGLRRGSSLSNAGIEIDHTAASSPPGTQVIADVPDLFGPGLTAQMTYYETRRGAKVFAAGAFTLAGSVWQPDVRRLMANLWSRLARP